MKEREKPGRENITQRRRVRRGSAEKEKSKNEEKTKNMLGVRSSEPTLTHQGWGTVWDWGKPSSTWSEDYAGGEEENLGRINCAAMGRSSAAPLRMKWREGAKEGLAGGGYGYA